MIFKQIRNFVYQLFHGSYKMKYSYIFCLILCWFSPIAAEEQIALPALPEEYLKDLEELGYCVIPHIFSTAETEDLYERVWHEYIEKAWPHCKMDDRSNWKKLFPIHQKYGTFVGAAGQIQVMWDLRQDPRIIEVFAHIWNTHDLIVSMDGLSIMCPPEIRDGYVEPWPHVDQNFSHDSIDFVSESPLKTAPFTIQGQFLFEDSFNGDGGFYCIPKSHLRFPEFAPYIDAYAWGREKRQEFFNKFFDSRTDDSGNPYHTQHVTAPRGSLILWDSRTVHWNQHPSKDRPYREPPKVRMVGYLCYVPKSRLTEEGKSLRQTAFEEGIATTHDPANPKLRRTKDMIWKEFEEYLEDPNYTQPKIHLTPLGEALLN